MSASYDIPLRLRRLRYNSEVRRLIRSVELQPKDLVLPLFVRHGEGTRQPIASMPGQFQWSVDLLEEPLQEAERLGVGGVILFGIPASKDEVGTDSYSEQGIVQQAVRAVKQTTDSLLTMTDVCFCEYTDHGHCGVLDDDAQDVNNDATLPLLAKQAVSHAEAGADIVAPSGMLDGMVSAIRDGLDAEGHERIPILSYAAKYASAFYGPFRDAAESAPQFGDRRTYQMDPCSHPGQAMREIEIDLSEGADMVMVKPALAYLDILEAAKDTFPGVPLSAYNVSGEYAMTKAAAERGWIDEQAVVLETLASIRRAGADFILTYWALDVARWLA